MAIPHEGRAGQSGGPVKVALVGHSYLAEENRKSLTALAKLVQVEVVSPDTTRNIIFDFTCGKDGISGDGWTLKAYPKWLPPLAPSSAYLLKSWDLGFRRFQPDIVHIEYDPFTPIFLQAFLTARRLAPRARFVVMVRQNTFTRRGAVADRLKIWLARRLVPRVDRFMAVNSGVAELYQTLFGARPQQIVPCTQVGVDTELFSPPPPEEAARCRERFHLQRGDALIGFCGRLQPDKGITELVAAVKLLRKQSGLEARLVLLGSGEMRGELVAQAQTSPWLTVLDRIPHADVADFMKGLDIFVMPSRVLKHHEEHDAHALMEAMSVGVASIGTASGAIIDVLGDAGIIVPPERPEELAAALGRLTADESLRNEYGRQGRQQIQSHYSLESVAAIYAETYRQILNLQGHTP